MALLWRLGASTILGKRGIREREVAFVVAGAKSLLSRLPKVSDRMVGLTGAQKLTCKEIDRITQRAGYPT